MRVSDAMSLEAGRSRFTGRRNSESQRFRFGFLCGVLLVPALLLVTPARAEVFLGLKAGSMDVDVPARKNPWNMAAHLGFQLDNRRADTSLMFEINRSVSRGEVRGGGDLEFESEAVFLRVRTTSSLFVALRGGIVQHEISVDGDSRSDDGLLLGGGVGFVSGSSRIQLEYTSYAGDADFHSLNIEF